MMKQEIAIWRKVERVRCIKDFGGFDVFSVHGLTEGKTYEPIGMAFKTYVDRSRELCYIIKDDNGIVSLRSTGLFEVIE